MNGNVLIQIVGKNIKSYLQDGIFVASGAIELNFGFPKFPEFI